MSSLRIRLNVRTHSMAEILLVMLLRKQKSNANIKHVSPDISTKQVKVTIKDAKLVYKAI